MTTLRDVMAPDPVTIAPDATVAEAASIMVQRRVGSLLVRAEGSVVGILTERDVLRAAGAGGDLLTTRVRDWMTREPESAPGDQDTGDALATMLASGFRHLPVTAGEEVIGIVSLRDLVGDGGGAGGPRSADNDADVTDPAPEESPTTVRERRHRMHDATRGLKQASHADAADGDAWRGELAAAAALVDDVVAHHIAETEGDGGLYDELVTESGGRLSGAVRRLHRDHERSTELVAELRAAIDARADVAALRQQADELFAQLEAHRHRGSDLLWQAYGVEIGGSD